MTMNQRIGNCISFSTMFYFVLFVSFFIDVKSIHVAIPISLGATSVTSAMLPSQMELAEAVEVVMVVDVVAVEEVLEAEGEEIVIVVDVAEDLEEAEVLEEVGTEEVVAQ